MKYKYIIIIIAIGGLFFMLKDSFTQPGVKDLEGNFKETAYYRNENNTGPILRFYAVTVSDTLYQQMIEYGNLMPHTKYGTTKVFFFRNAGPSPKTLAGASPHFDESYVENCIGVYEKNGMSQVAFSKDLK